jgi:phage tail sheath protein FI
VADANNFIKIGATATPATQLTGTFLFPSVPTRTSSDDGIITNQTDAYFGATANMKDSNRVEASVKDMLRRKPNNKGVQATNPEAIEYSWLFSLDDVEAGVSGSTATWVSGSRKAGDSYTATGDYKTVLDAGFDSFTTLLSEGFEGVNILEKEPFRNTLLGGVTAGTSYTYASLERAIDTVADADVVECNMMSVPGLTESTLTSRLMDVCEARGDALAVIDLPGGYKPITEDANASDSDRIGSVDDTVNLLNDRNINNSYGCAYYPWVQVTDTVTTGGSLWAPPSVVVLGTLASSQAASELWFAPAGFTRGGLTEGSAGLPVTNVRARLNSKERDSLYNTNINPIAQFPAEGIVIFGQKTLQVSQSALDRINVRRLMIYVKREISRIAATMLFEQNVQATWNRFLGKVNPFLGSIKTRLGLTDYLVILDETTTTPDLVDRNILYAKIFLKPARAIEFIALDFVITRTGAGFED